MMCYDMFIPLVDDERHFNMFLLYDNMLQLGFGVKNQIFCIKWMFGDINPQMKLLQCFCIVWDGHTQLILGKTRTSSNSHPWYLTSLVGGFRMTCSIDYVVSMMCFCLTQWLGK